MKVILLLVITLSLILLSGSTSLSIKATLEDIEVIKINEDKTILIYSSNKYNSEYYLIRADISKYSEISFANNIKPVFTLKKNKNDSFFAILKYSEGV